jgi:hypothetical protein
MRIRLLAAVMFCAAALGFDTTAVQAAAWTPPIGIPAPSFGINESAPATPSPWTTATAGFYYVDGTNAKATDSSNPYGTPAKPRQTIPTTLPAGSVVELHGTYDVSHSSPDTIVSQGTSSKPVYIRGVSSTSRPLARRAWELQGTYMIVENVEFGPMPDQSATGSVVILLPSSHIVLRNDELHGTLTDGGLGIVNWLVPYGVPYTGSGVIDNVVIYHNSIHDNGNVNATYDQDVHGIAISDHVNTTWIVDNEIYRNSGDGLQINAQTGQRATTHHIYIGRNVSHDNKQSGFWVKEATDVILSQNQSYNHRPSDSSLGQCMGAQYAPDYVWFLFNNVHDCEYGITQVSDDGTLTSHVNVIGNLIHGIHHSQSSNPDSAWGPSAVMYTGGSDRHIVNNTIYDVDSGVNIATPSGTQDVADNIIVNVTMAQASDLLLDFSGSAPNTTFIHNLLFPDARLDWGNGQTHPTAAQLATYKSINADPQFVNATGGDFHLLSSSPAIGAGDVNSSYAAFQQRYGVSIAFDIEGTPRPSSAYSLGAYEKPCTASTGTPSAPQNLTGSNSASAITLQWAAPAAAGCSAPPSGYMLEIGNATGLSNLANVSVGSVTTLSIPATGVPAGTYYFRVRAKNATGEGAPSNEVVLTYAVPNAPTALTVTKGTSSVTVAWKAPSGGATVTGYVLEVGSATGLSDRGKYTLGVTPTTFTGALPAKGTYFMRIRAQGASGTSAPTNEVKLVIP